jgi:uncharacterized protein YfaQ (DUF2300 family)
MITSVTASKLWSRHMFSSDWLPVKLRPGTICTASLLHRSSLAYLHSIEVTATQQYRGIYETALAELVSLFVATFLQRQSNCASMCGTHIDTHLR